MNVDLELESGELKMGDVFLWYSRMNDKYEIHTFHSHAGYGIKTFSEWNEKNESSLLVNYSGVCGKIKSIKSIISAAVEQ